MTGDRPGQAGAYAVPEVPSRNAVAPRKAPADGKDGTPGCVGHASCHPLKAAICKPMDCLGLAYEGVLGPTLLSSKFPNPYQIDMGLGESMRWSFCPLCLEVVCMGSQGDRRQQGVKWPCVGKNPRSSPVPPCLWEESVGQVL